MICSVNVKKDGSMPTSPSPILPFNYKSSMITNGSRCLAAESSTQRFYNAAADKMRSDGLQDLVYNDLP